MSKFMKDVDKMLRKVVDYQKLPIHSIKGRGKSKMTHKSVRMCKTCHGQGIVGAGVSGGIRRRKTITDRRSMSHHKSMGHGISGGRPRTKHVRKATSEWITFVKDFARKHDMKYGDALKAAARYWR